MRPIITKILGSKEYIGIDIREGPLVDYVMDACEALDKFGPNSFDYIICMEMLEHAYDWRRVINNIKGMLKPHGTLFLTTRSLGFPLHEYPADYWRFEEYDALKMFQDFDDTVMPQAVSYLQVYKDPEQAGIFVKATKPQSWTADAAADLNTIQVHSMR